MTPCVKLAFRFILRENQPLGYKSQSLAVVIGCELLLACADQVASQGRAESLGSDNVRLFILY